MTDFPSLNHALEEKMIAKRQEKHYKKIKLIERLWQEEKQVLMLN